MSTFDDKVFEYIKNASGGGGGSDISFPVGMSIKLASGTSPPSTGTWELKGIYGQHYYYDGTFYHWTDFLGTSIIDSVQSIGNISSGYVTTWSYDNILGSGNYKITTTFGGYLNEDPVNGPNVMDAYLSNGGITYCISQKSSLMTFSGEGKGVNCQVRADITDVSKVTVSDDNLFYEYQRTA